MQKKPPVYQDKYQFSPAERLSSSRLLLDSKSCTDFTSFDYFNFHQDTRIRDALFRAAQLSSLIAPAPRSLGGTSEEHIALEVALSHTYQQSNALVVSSRHQAALTLITSIISENDIVIYDEDTAAPIADACYLVGATAHALDPLAPDMLATVSRIVSQAPPHAHIYLFLEELSSTTGHLAHVPDILSILKFLGVTLILDVTFSLGITNHLLMNENIIIIGGFGLSAPGVGGFIVGGSPIDHIKHRSKVLATEAPIPPYVATFNRHILTLLPELSLKLGTVLEKALEFYTAIRSVPAVSILSLGSALTPNTPILSLQFSNEEIARAFSQKLADHNIIAARLSRGSLRSSRNVLRFNFTSSLTAKDITTLTRLFLE